MLSTFGFDPKGASRNSHSGSRFLPSAPRGLSVHVFKNSALTSQPAPAPPVVIPSKYDPVPSRPSTGGGQWNRQLSYHPSPNDSERKQTSAAPASQDHRLIHVPSSQPWPVETKHSKSQKSYGIYPSLTSDIYIYERSISSVSLDDDLTHSPSSDSSSDSDLLYGTATHANLEISSTRASSSTETLESTLTAPRTFPNTTSSLPPPRPAITAPQRPASTRPPPPAETSAAFARSAVPLTRADSHAQRNISISHTTVPPIQLASAPLDDPSDSDSDTVISDSHANDMVVDMLGAHWAGPPSYSYPSRISTPFHRESDSRTGPSSTYRRDAPAPSVPISRDSRDPPATRPSAPLQYHPRADSPRGEDAAHPRAPPGLSGAVATPPDGSTHAARDVQTASSAHAPTVLSSRSLTSAAPPLARSPSSRPAPAGSPPGPRARNADMGSSSHLPPPSQPTPSASAANAFVSSSPPRRDARMSSAPQQQSPTTKSPNGIPSSAGAPHAQVQTPSPHSSPTTAVFAGALVVASVAKRNVRWTENLVCPSPVPLENRRKGWFNRRGDQLWTNDGQYKLPEPGQEYPPDLDHYPEPNSGWMNEEGVRIDMQHRLIPKPPLRSALKRPKPVNGNV
ncbi:hypothetical protein C8Q80DRAFT_825730 [Daedaleopsis nitida]|nr:hypothetical protein C8Q80DRAFT_825730 [Daedaleopsis nitida]